MSKQATRREFLNRTRAVAGGAVLAGMVGQSRANAASNNPNDYIIVEGHRDIWEFNARFALKDKSQWNPMHDFVAPRLIEGGYSVVIMPCGGDSIDERGGRDPLVEGSLRTLDMLLTEVEKTKDKVSIIRTKADLPERPNRGKVQIFLDMEGGASISDPEPEPGYNRERQMALLRQFFRLGMRGLQLTHNGRNMLGQGIAEGKMGNRLSDFGVAVVKEMNCLGMMVGVSHLSANGLLHAAEISTKPIVSTHQNINPFLKTPLELVDEEVKAVAKTGGIVGIRYIAGETPYKLLVDEVEYLAKRIGVEHIGVGWLGHDVGNPDPHYIPGYSKGKEFSGVEAETMRKHWETFIAMLAERGFTEQQIGLIVGGNYIRIWKQILPDVDPAPTVGCPSLSTAV